VSWQAARAALDLDIPPSAKFAYIALALRAGKDGRAWPSIARLMADTGYSRATVHRALSRLADDGLIEVVHRHGSSSIRSLGGLTVRPTPITGETPPISLVRPRSSKEVNQEVATTGSTAKRPAVANGNGRAHPQDCVCEGMGRVLGDDGLARLCETQP
jgi:DNA-binding transcriptional MocR family regulator